MRPRAPFDGTGPRTAAVAPPGDAWPETGPAVLPEPPPEGGGAEAALNAWRGKAVQIVLVVVATAHLPVIILGWLGYGPPMGGLFKGVGIGVYLVVAAAALLYRVDYRLRLVACFLPLYLALALVSVAYPHGPYAQGGVLTTPIFVLVLMGAPAARIAVVASTAIVVSAPFLSAQPDVVRALGMDVALTAGPSRLVWFRATVRAASLLGVMFLLARFHRFLLGALTERIAAQRRLEREMRERQRIEREIAAIGDGERQRLGHELHDGVCQQIAAALLHCQGLQQRLRRGGTLSEVDFAMLSSLMAETIDEAHDVARGLCPLEPDPEALAPGLRALARRMQQTAGLRCEFVSGGDVRVADPEAAQHLYRIAQEALSNAVRHAKASRISVALRGGDGELTLQVEDNGVGLPTALPADRMGLRTMAYRAEIIRGELTVACAPGGGTRVTCRVPQSTARPVARVQPGETRWTPAT